MNNKLKDLYEWVPRPELDDEQARQFWDSLTVAGRRELLILANSQIGTTVADLARFEGISWDKMPKNGRTDDVRRWIKKLGNNPERFTL